ncbi:hypothetical protein SAMN02910398_02151 [Butyrivibrio sp. YAB3001]|nr:hypothetical protein SAMN02910398_02151 [Butyrivibrio sp. YAB3001]
MKQSFSIFLQSLLIHNKRLQHICELSVYLANVIIIHVKELENTRVFANVIIIGVNKEGKVSNEKSITKIRGSFTSNGITYVYFAGTDS